MNRLLALILIVLFTTSVKAQNPEFGTWTGVSVSKKLTKDFRVKFSPEFRFGKGFSLDEFLAETSLEYEPITYFSIKGKYRFETNPRENKETEYFHKYALDLNGKYTLHRFKFQLRTRYTNYSEFDTDYGLLNPYLRYRIKTKYNIKNCKLSPYVSLEYFYQLADREFNKVRYTLGFDYKLKKNHYLSLAYHYQDYLKKDYARNVMAIQYKFKF